MAVSFREILSRPGIIAFPSNRPYVQDLAEAGGRAVRQASGHLIFYDRHHRRFLSTDPVGTPLHECEWTAAPDGTMRLRRARLHLDWGQWVGITPSGMVNTTTLDLSRRPNWQGIRPDDLRRMAAQALGVPLEEIRFFYTDEDLQIDPAGQATIRHRKDALYVLEEGTFAEARFMACMGALHWDRIDFLPVVELFQSLLPGTGSATIELIRGLYDDQNPTDSLPLRYRGMPTYPSEAAYRLFSTCFRPSHPSGDPLSVFMNVPRSHEVTWVPSEDPPRRYFDRERHLCVTTQGKTVRKVTAADDATGLPFLPPRQGGRTHYNRCVRVSHGALMLQDGGVCREIPVQASWGSLADSSSLPPIEAPSDWRTLFVDGLPVVRPADAFRAVLLYPEDDHVIEEVACQPFVADYLQDALEQSPDLRSFVSHAQSLLIENFDATIPACLPLDRPRQATILYRWPAFAQKGAQAIWNQLATAGHLDWLGGVRMMAANKTQEISHEQSFDLVYQWLMFDDFMDNRKLNAAVSRVGATLAPRSLAFVVGPQSLEPLLISHRLAIHRAEPVEGLPTFTMHRTLLPNARLKAGLTLFTVIRR